MKEKGDDQVITEMVGRIESILKEKKIKKKDLGDILSKNSLYYWKSHKTTPNITTSARLAKRLGVSIDYLFYGKEERDERYEIEEERDEELYQQNAFIKAIEKNNIITQRIKALPFDLQQEVYDAINGYQEILDKNIAFYEQRLERDKVDYEQRIESDIVDYQKKIHNAIDNCEKRCIKSEIDIL